MKKTLPSIKAVSEELRIRIVLLLMNREACVCELMAVFGMAQSRLSHHLIILREAGFLRDKKRGKWNYYRLNTGIPKSLNSELLLLLSRWLTDDGTIKRDREMLETVRKQMRICC
jgi:ArsR family transcriptional regulator, arsenate/arsenite/antimonite-responsive transcriptional repressor